MYGHADGIISQLFSNTLTENRPMQTALTCSYDHHYSYHFHPVLSVVTNVIIEVLN